MLLFRAEKRALCRIVPPEVFVAWKVSLLGLGLCVGATAVAPPRAAACGALPTPAFQFDGVLPSDGATGVMLSAPLAFALRCEENSSELVREAACAQLPISEAQVELMAKDASELVSGELQQFGGRLVFTPDAPLAPDTEYVYIARLPSSPVEGGVAPVLQGGFRTGTASVPPVRADELMAPKLEAYEGNAVRCDLSGEASRRLVGRAADDALAPAICPNGWSCAPDGRAKAKHFLVQVSNVTGGYAALGYEAELRVTFHAPASSGTAGGDWAHLEEGGSEILMLDLPELEDDAEVCARVRAYDALGSEVSRELCKPYAQLVSEIDLSGDEGIEDAATNTDYPPLRSDSNAESKSSDAGTCSLVPAHSANPSPLALTFAALLGALYRRRRSRH